MSPERENEYIEHVVKKKESNNMVKLYSYRILIE